VTYIDRSDLYSAIRGSWSRTTSVAPDGWSDSNPAWGQCAVTALVVQDALGGRIIRTVVGGTSHYFNLLPDGAEVDLTAEQFGERLVRDGHEERTRDYLLSFPDTAQRYAALKERFLARSATAAASVS